MKIRQKLHGRGEHWIEERERERERATLAAAAYLTPDLRDEFVTYWRPIGDVTDT